MYKRIKWSQNSNKEVFYKTLTTNIKRFFTSMHFVLYVMLVVLAIMPLIVVNSANSYYYNKELINSDIARIQTEAAVVAGDFSPYASLIDAKKDDVYTQLVVYSMQNSVRIRIINTDFKTVFDSYSIETGKTLVNSRVISCYNSSKSLSGFIKETQTIEAVVPIINQSGEKIGIFMLDSDMTEINAISDSVNVKTNSIYLAVGVLIFILAGFLTKNVLKSLMRTLKTVEEVSIGHSDKRLAKKGYTELKDFAESFNTILDKNNALDQNRQEFVSNVSHELKTPITSIKVLADSLNMQEDVPIELYKEFMQDIANEIDRESKIIEDLLSLVRMDNPYSELNISSVNLNEMLEIVLKRLKPIAQKKNVEILFESFRPVVAEVDEVKFTQVISNLVENAIKYNKMDGWVHVSLNADYQYFYIRVEDSGLGIPKESQEMVFERFYRVDKARSRETGGTGLGLAIVKKIILMHHGTVKLHSEEGEGTTFTVRIPLNYVDQRSD